MTDRQYRDLKIGDAVEIRHPSGAPTIGICVDKLKLGTILLKHRKNGRTAYFWAASCNVVKRRKQG